MSISVSFQATETTASRRHCEDWFCACHCLHKQVLNLPLSIQINLKTSLLDAN